jgi:hypothetical protein
MTDPCRYEADIAVLKEIVPRIEGKIDKVEGILSDKIQNNLEQVQKSMGELNRAIKGANSDPGLSGIVGVLKSSVKRLWWFVGMLVLIILGSVVKQLILK